MTKSDIALKEACMLAEEMCYEDLLERFEAQPVVLIPTGQYERISRLIYGRSFSKTVNSHRKDKNKSSKRFKTALLVAAIIIILLSVSATAFSPIRDFFMKIYRDCTEIVFNVTDKDDYLFAEYAYIPEGYKKEKDIRNKSAKNQSMLYQKDKKIIKINTMRNKHSSTFIDTENAKTGEVFVNGRTGYYSITETSFILVWSTGKYSHCIVADENEGLVSIETLVKIAQSRQPIE